MINILNQLKALYFKGENRMNKELIFNIIIENEYNSSKYKTYLNSEKINFSLMAKSLKTNTITIKKVLENKDKYISKYNLYLDLNSYDELINESINDFKTMIKSINNYIDNYKFN
jgi:hypothetical protein